jgi:hypothetical protein
METPTNAAPVTPETSVSQPVMDVSQGYPVPTGTQGVPPESIQTNAEAAAPLTTPDEMKAAGERLKQQNARQAKLLSSLGIDPLSDIAEQLESGLITPEMVMNHVVSRRGPTQQSQQPTEQQQSSDPVSVAEREYQEAKTACETEGQQTGQLSFETNKRYMEAAMRLNDVKAQNITRQLTADRQVQQANENVDSVLTVARNNAYYPVFDQKLKQYSDFAHVAMTAAIVNQEASRMGLDANNLSPKQYEYFAGKATEYFGELAEALVEMGRQQVRKNISPANVLQQRTISVPAGPGGSGIPVANPYAKVNHTNHVDAARQYMAGQRGQV